MRVDSKTDRSAAGRDPSMTTSATVNSERNASSSSKSIAYESFP